MGAYGLYRTPTGGKGNLVSLACLLHMLSIIRRKEGSRVVSFLARIALERKMSSTFVSGNKSLRRRTPRMKTGHIRLFKHFLPGAYLLLMGVEALLFASSYLLGGAFTYPEALWATTHIKQSVGLAALMSLSQVAVGMYSARVKLRKRDHLVRLLVAFALTAGAVVLIGLTLPVQMPDPRAVFIGSAIALVGVMMTRYLFSIYVVDLDMWNRRVMVVGTGQAAAKLANIEQSELDMRSYSLVGFVRMPGERVEVADARLLPTDRSLNELALLHDVDEIVVAMDDRREALPVEDLFRAKLNGVSVHDMVAFVEREGGLMDIDRLSSGWMVFSDGFLQGSLRRASKRSFDVLISLSMLLLVWPIMLLAMLMVWLDDGGPVLFRQVRVGEKGKHFTLMKFRSMRVDAEKGTGAVWADKHDDRTTRIGAFLRMTRIDELPQLLNVLRGDMSFVGPRPERPEFESQLVEAVPHYVQRYAVKPGVTGWAQINYPYGASIEDAHKKQQYDLYYVKNHSLFLDFMIMIQTVEVVLWGRGR